MEEIVAAHPAVAECAVIGIADELKGQVPMGFVVLKADAAIDPADIERDVVAMVRDRVGPVASFKHVVVVQAIAQNAIGQDSASYDTLHRRR